MTTITAAGSPTKDVDTLGSVADTVWDFGSSDGQVRVVTGVAGPAAKMGHRLTLSFDWQATVQWADDEPSAVELTVDVDSLKVVRGDGGVKGLSGPEKALARSNALGSLDAKRHPRIVFRADQIDHSTAGYRLTGDLEIHGTTRPQVVELAVEDAGSLWRLSADVTVRQSDFGVKPYSLMMGALKVADEVTVSFSAERGKS